MSGYVVRDRVTLVLRSGKRGVSSQTPPTESNAAASHRLQRRTSLITHQEEVGAETLLRRLQGPLALLMPRFRAGRGGILSNHFRRVSPDRRQTHGRHR